VTVDARPPSLSAIYFRREVQPHVPDEWIDEERTKVGYEIPFNRCRPGEVRRLGRYRRRRSGCSSAWYPRCRSHLQLVERCERARLAIEEMAPQLGKLLAGFREGAVFHFDDARRIVQRVATFGSGLVDAPDRLTLMTVAGDDLRRAEGRTVPP
jgi:hypothetical protein